MTPQEELEQRWKQDAEAFVRTSHYDEYGFKGAYIAGRRASQSEIDALKIQLSNYAYQIDSAKRERDKAEAELSALKEVAQKVCDTWAPMEHARLVDELSRLLTPPGEFRPKSVIEVAKAAYNLGLEDAAYNAKVGSDYLPSKNDLTHFVDRDSILKLKIQ